MGDITNLIQTEVSNLSVSSEPIEKSPGENVQVELKVLDEQKSLTIAFLKIDVIDDNEKVRIIHMYLMLHTSCPHTFCI